MRYFLREKSQVDHDSETACNKPSTRSRYPTALNSISIPITTIIPLSLLELRPLHMRSGGHPDQ